MKEYLSATAAGTQTLEDIDNLMASLAPYPLEKAELLQIINERPDSVAELDCIIEEMDNRFDEDTQMVILEKIKEMIPAKPKVEDVNGI